MQSSCSSGAPLLVAPSGNKFLYMQELSEFWRETSGPNECLDQIVIVGFSMPEHDEYIRQTLYRMISCFQQNECPYTEIRERRQNLAVVDFRRTHEQRENLRKRYSFIDWTKTETYWEGLNMEVIAALRPSSANAEPEVNEDVGRENEDR